MLAWILIPLGIVMVAKANKIFEFTGEIRFAEDYMPMGGTVGMIKLVGLGLTIGAFMWLVGGGESIKNVLQRFF